MIGLILFVLGMVALLVQIARNHLREIHLKKVGQVAIGTVEEITPLDETDSNDNRRYTLRISTALDDGTEHQILVNKAPPADEAHKTAPGLLVPVLIDPDDPTNMTLGGEEHLAEASALIHQQRVAKGLTSPSPGLERYAKTTTGVLSRIEPTGVLKQGEVEVLVEIKATLLGSTACTVKDRLFTAKHALWHVPGNGNYSDKVLASWPLAVRLRAAGYFCAFENIVAGGSWKTFPITAAKVSANCGF